MSMNYITIKFNGKGKKIRYGDTYLIEGIVDSSGKLITSYDSFYNNTNFTKYLKKRVERLRELVFSGKAELVVKYDDVRKYLAYIPVSFFLTPDEYCNLTGIDCKGLTIVEHLYNNVMNVSNMFTTNNYNFWKDLNTHDDFTKRAGESIFFISVLNSECKGDLYNYIFKTNKTYLITPSHVPFTFNMRMEKFSVEGLLTIYKELFHPLMRTEFYVTEKTISFIIELVSNSEYISVNLKHYYGTESFKEKW